jgi:hypothetical protein
VLLTLLDLLALAGGVVFVAVGEGGQAVCERGDRVANLLADARLQGVLGGGCSAVNLAEAALWQEIKLSEWASE